MLQFSRRNVSNADYCDREVGMSSFIPYVHHWDRETIVTSDNSLMQVIKLDGFSFETADDEDVDMKKMVRNSLLKSMTESTFAMWFHTIRRRKSGYPGGEQPEGFARYLDELWHRKHESHDTYVNELYITIIRRNEAEKSAILDNLFARLNQGGDASAVRKQSFLDKHKELSEAIYRVLATLKDYGPRVLGARETDHGVFSEPMEFLGRLVNCGSWQPMLYPNMPINQYLPNRRLYFGSRAVEARGNADTHVAGMISIREYSPATAAGMMDSFLQLPMEFIISQSFVCSNRQDNIGKMQLKQRQMMNAQDVAISQVAEISDALDMAMSGHVAFGEHHLTVMCMEEDGKQLEKSLSMAIAELVNVGINPAREKWVLEQCYWAQLPGNYSFVCRGSRIHTLNLASFAALHNYPVGRITGNHWGDAVTVLNTTSGTPFYFNFHARDVGHTTIIGPTGAGKTVLMNFLTAQAQKFNPRTFLFDKDRGAEIFVRALGGQYTMLEPSKPCGFNPLQLPDTHEHRNFIAEWLKALVSANGETLSAYETQIIAQAVDGNFKLDPKDRRLRNIAAFLGLEEPGSLSSRLRPWHGEGQYARMFDNEQDIIDFHSDTLFGFEMGHLLNDKMTIVPTLLYLFHRIQMSLDGTPTIIILDEAWALLDNPVFAIKIKDWLKTLRKLNGMVVFATQSVEDAVRSTISDTLIQQTATQIFLPNQKATELYKQAFMLSDREYNLLKTTDPGSRYFLVKQGKDVVVARIDLSGMEDAINILSGRAETVGILDKVLQEHGNDPNEWIPLFMQRVKKEQ